MHRANSSGSSQSGGSNTPNTPTTGRSLRWHCKSCGNRNKLKHKQCIKCNAAYVPSAFDVDDIELTEKGKHTKPAPLTRVDFMKTGDYTSKYLQRTQKAWAKQLIKSKTRDVMEHESSADPCVHSLDKCPCAQRAVFIQRLYRDWCRALTARPKPAAQPAIKSKDDSNLPDKRKKPPQRKGNRGKTETKEKGKGNNKEKKQNKRPKEKEKQKTKQGRKQNRAKQNLDTPGGRGHKKINSTPLTRQNMKKTGNGNSKSARKDKKQQKQSKTKKQNNKNNKNNKKQTAKNSKESLPNDEHTDQSEMDAIPMITLQGRHQSDGIVPLTTEHESKEFQEEKQAPELDAEPEPEDTHTMSIRDILENLLKNYSVSQLIEDRNHIDSVHCNDSLAKKNSLKETRKYMAIFTFFKTQMGKCDDCTIFRRSGRDRRYDYNAQKRHTLYYGFTQPEDVTIITRLDTYHRFWFHSTNLFKIDGQKSYKTLTKLDEDYEDEDEEAKQPQPDSIKSQTSQNEPVNASKFVTSINDEELKEELDNQHLSNFEFGEHFEYWEHYSSYDNFIEPRFRNLKEELLNNGVFPVAQAVYDDICATCKHLKDTQLIRKMTAMKNFYNDIAHIQQGEVITEHHLICIMIYTNHSDIQKKYKETLRLPTSVKIQKDDALYQQKYHELKQRNSQIATWCRLLFESVRFWGTIMTERNIFFHGIDRTLLFDKFYAAFKCPISTTTNLMVAQQFQDNTEGIIIKVSCYSEKSMIPFLDVSFISDFREESERLFYGADLNIIDILWKKCSFDLISNALSLFQYMVSGGFFTHHNRFMNHKNQKRLVSLIENHLKYHNRRDLVLEKKKNSKKATSESDDTDYDEKNAKSKKGKKQEKKQNRSGGKNKSGTEDTQLFSADLKEVKEDEKPAIVSQPKPISLGQKQKKRKYFHELFDFFVSSRRNGDLWLCQSEMFDKRITQRLRRYFIERSEDKSAPIKYGNFVLYWREKYNVNVLLSQEFEWKIGKKNLDTFLNLPAGHLLQSPRYEYHLSTNEHSVPQRIIFYAECCRWSQSDPGWADFYWNVHELPPGVSEIQVTLDVQCQEGRNNTHDDETEANSPKGRKGKGKGKGKRKKGNGDRMISHDIYEGEWMSTLETEQDDYYFGGKAFEILKEFYNSQSIVYEDEEKTIVSSAPIAEIPKIAHFLWRMAVRVTTIAYTPNMEQNMKSIDSTEPVENDETQ